MFSPDTKILIVDDMATMRRIVKNSLKDLGFKNFVEANNGRAGWEAMETGVAKDSAVQLIICDWNMPEISGLELLAKIRGDSRFSSVPFLMLTAESEKKQVEKANLAGASSYITKPFSPIELREHLQTVFDSGLKAGA